jgi:hypothetical protein
MGGSVGELIVLSAVWLVAIVAVFTPLAIRQYSKLT